MTVSAEEESRDEKPSRLKKISLFSKGRRYSRASASITRKTVRPNPIVLQPARELQEEGELLIQYNYPLALVEPREIKLRDPPGEILPNASYTVIDVPEEMTRNLVVRRIVPHEEETVYPSKTSARRILLNSWFWKISLSCCVFAAAALILSYSIFFLIVFAIFGREISFYPWSWGVMYTSAIGAGELMLIGFVASALSLALSVLALKRSFLPGFRISYFG